MGLHEYKREDCFMENKKLSKKKLVIGSICLAALIIVLSLVYTQFMPKGQTGSKNIEVEIIYGDDSTKTFTINTDEEFLRGALEQENLVEGTESEYGLFIHTVDDWTADDSNQEWWLVTKGGEMVTTGIDTTPIADKDHFELTLTVGY